MPNFFKKLTTISLVLLMSFTSLNIPAKVYAEDISEPTQENDHEHDHNETTEENVELFSSFELDVSPSEQDGFLYIQDVAVVSIRSLNEYPSDFIEEVILINDFEDSDLLIQDSFLDSQTKFSVKENVYAFNILNNSEYSNDSFAISLRFDNPFLSFSEEELEEKQEEIKQYYDDFESRFQDSKLFLINKDNEVKELEYQFFKDNLIISFNSSEIGRFFFVKLEEILPESEEIEVEQFEEKEFSVYDPNLQLEENEILLEDTLVETTLVSMPEIIDENFHLEVPSVETFSVDLLGSALPQDIQPSTLPITVDGVSIEKATMRWLSKSTGSNEPAKFNDLVLVPSGNIAPNQQWQLDFSLSGKGTIDVGDLEIVIPAYIWKDRNGNEPGRLTLAIPEEPAHNGDFAWKRVDDTYVITNVRRISAGSKYMIQGTFRMTYPDPNSDKPFTSTPTYLMNDINTVDPNAEYKGASDWLYANIMILTPTHQEELSATTNLIRATIDTKVEATVAEKKVTESDVFIKNVPINIPSNLLPDNPEDYYYVRWYIAGEANGNQPYTMKLVDNLTDEHNGILLGFESGDNQVVNAREGSVDIYQGYSFNSVKSTRVWTAYPKSAFPNEDTIYTVTNDLTVEVRGVDDEVLSTKTTSASARIRKPATYYINKVWEYNADKYETDLETIMSRRPSSVRVSLSGVSFSDYLSESNNWHTEYVDNGTGAKPTDAYESLNPSGVISSERIYYPDGSYSVRESRWSYVLRKKDYDAQTKTWTFYNEYVETSGVRYYRHFTAVSSKDATNHRDSYVRSLTDKDLVFLRNSQETTDITYNVHRSLSTINYTAKNTLNFYNDDNLHQNTVRLEIEDHSEYLNGVKLNENDCYFVYATLPNPNAYFWSGSDRIFSSANKIAAEMYGKVGSEWVKFAEIDENGQITPFNEATIDDNKVIFPRTNVLQTKLVTRTNGDWLSAGYNVGLRIKPSETVVQQVEDEFSLSDYVMMNSRNEVSFKLYNDSTDALLNTTNNAAVTYLHGRNYRLAVDLDKTTAYIKNDRSNRQLVWKNTITLNRVSTIPNLLEFNYAVSENMFSDSKSGVFYDLLPAGMRVDESSIRPVSNINIKNVNIIENYKDSGRQLLIIEAGLNNIASVINVATNSNKYNDETHPCYRNQTVYGWAPSVVSFEMTYSYDEAKNRGLTDLRNHAAYVADEQAFGDVKYWSGENDIPNGQNHKETLGEVREDARELMTDLSESNSPNTVYAGAILTLSEVDFSALTNIVKQVSITGSDAWSYGFDNEVNVSEGGKYSYRITLTSGTDTTTKDIIILDSLENYTPIKVTDSGDSTIPVGRVISQREFNETNELIEINGGNLIQGEPAWSWQGYFRGIDISEITSLGVDAKVYYSTAENLDITAYNPDSETGVVPEVLSDTSVWSLTPPADPSSVTAIAIDCRKKVGGADFELKSDESLIAYVHMKAPTYSQAPDAFGEDYKDFLQNAHAFNNVFMDVTQIDDLGLTTHSYDHFDFTQVGIYGMDVKVKKIWDDQNDNDRVRPEEIEVELLANNESTGKKLTLNSQGNWEGIFDHVLEFDDNDNRINYSIAESVEEYTPSIKKEITGNLTTITVTNKHELFKTDYPFTKVWVSEEADGWQANIPSSITVRLLADGVFTGKTQIVRPDSSGEWSGVFANLQKMKDGVDIEYSVEEVPLSSDWITEYEGNQIKNTYYPYGDLIVKKQVINSTPESKDNLFKFTISLKDKNNEYLIDEYNYTIFNENNEEVSTGTIKNGDEFELKENWLIEIKDIPSGSRYELSEENKAGYILSSKTNFSNTINAAVPQESVFTNTYNTTGSISITGNKTLTGRDITRNQFRFEIYDAEDKLIRTAGNTAEGLINFGSFTYGVNDNGKEFVYTVKEVDRGRPGYTYDDSVYTVKVFPVDNGDGTMTVTQNTFKNDIEAQSIDFANEYHAEGETTLRAWKELEVRKLQNEEFEFELIDEENNVIDTKKNSADGSIVFDTLHFDETDIGKTYYYAVREKLGDDPTVNYDRSVFGYALTVLDNGNGTLSISQGTASPIFGEPEEEQNEVFAKYAVSIWGIGQDTLEDGSTAGLTFGPAIGANYTNSFKSHTPSGVTSNGNAHRCIHDDDWNTIIEWNNVDPFVYEQCIAENCTHSVELYQGGETILNSNFKAKGTGDGASALYYELMQYNGSKEVYENLRWHPNNNMPNNASGYGTNYGGWGASRIRAMLNGADSLTDIGDGTAPKPGGKDVYSPFGANQDIHKSASVYTSTNNLLACFPEELQIAIGKRATKYDSIYNSKTETNLRTSYDKLWLLSSVELNYTGTRSDYKHPLEGSIYQKIAQNSQGINNQNNHYYGTYKFANNTSSSGSSALWCLRSFSSNTSYSALNVSVSGYITDQELYVSEYYGISPCFSLDRSITPSTDEQLPPIIGWETEDAELPIFRNTLKDGSLTISKLVENEENANPEQEFKFKIKLIGPGIENQQFEWEKEKLPYNAYLIYDANGGEFSDGATENKFTYLVNNNVSSLTNGEYEEPTREGYEFVGWYEDAEFTQEFTGNPEELSLLEDKRVYAKWKPSFTTKYAVQIYGIGQDENQNGEKMGLTFGPALGQDFMNTYISHAPSGLTENGNAHRCIHNDTWEEIINWNDEDPYVYEQCVGQNCTHSVELTLSDTLKNPIFVYGGSASGDGVGILYYELVQNNKLQHLEWNPLQSSNSTQYGTNYGGWGASRIRAMMNGADSLTTTGANYGTSVTDNYLPTMAATDYTGSDTLLSAFPQILQDNIGARKTLYDSVYNSRTATNLKTSYDKLWLLSPNEMANSISDGHSDHPLEAPNGKYQRFVENNLNLSASYNNAFKAFRQSGNTGTSGAGYSWWLRSLCDFNDSPNYIVDIFPPGGIDGLPARADDGISPCFALDTTYEFPKPVTTKYAVQIYGIEQDTLEDGSTAGLTFGPALGQDFMNTYISHASSGNTTLGNEHRCVHNDDWETIIHWNNVDPYVYEQCIGNNCTHSVNLTFPDYLKNTSFVYGGSSSGDGVGTLYNEFNNQWHRSWNPINNGADRGTNKDGWGASRIRAMMNGYDGLTMLKGSYSYYYSSIESVPETNYTSGSTLIDAFPQILQDNIGARKTLYDSVYNSKTTANLKTSYDKLWLLSPNEMTNDNATLSYNGSSGYLQHPLESNGVYQKFLQNNQYIKGYCYNGSSNTADYYNNYFKTYRQSGYTAISGTSGYWWLRSSIGNYDSGVLYVHYSGYVFDSYAYNGSCVSPCFALKRQVTSNTSSNNTSTENQLISNQNANAFNFDIQNISKKLSSVFSFNNIVHAEDDEIIFENGEAEVTLKKNEKITFNDIPAGTAYQVWEETPDGWVLIEQRNTSGEIMPLETSEAEFKNRYQPGTTSVQFNGTKLLDNIAAEEGSFSFELYEGEELLETVSVLDGGFIQFSVLSYTEAGTHNYTIKEVNPNSDTIDFDTHSENITVVVRDNGDGTLSSEVTYDEDGIVFRNNTRPGTLEIKKNVDISTNANKDDVFTFEIEFTNENGVPLSSDENIYWYRKDANGNLTQTRNLLMRALSNLSGDEQLGLEKNQSKIDDVKAEEPKMNMFKNIRSGNTNEDPYENKPDDIVQWTELSSGNIKYRITADKVLYIDTIDEGIGILSSDNASIIKYGANYIMVFPWYSYDIEKIVLLSEIRGISSDVYDFKMSSVFYSHIVGYENWRGHDIISSNKYLYSIDGIGNDNSSINLPGYVLTSGGSGIYVSGGVRELYVYANEPKEYIKTIGNVSDRGYFTGFWINVDNPSIRYNKDEFKELINNGSGVGHWRWEVCNILFDENGGTYINGNNRIWMVEWDNAATSTFSSYVSPRYITAPSKAELIKPGYQLLGFNTSPTASTVQYSLNSLIEWSESVRTLYAVWKYDGKNQINVNHLQESIGGEDYNLAETDVIRDIPGTEYSPELKSYSGFHAISSVETVVVDDEDLVIVNYYYDRDRYTIKFDGNGSTSGQMFDTINAVGGVSSVLPKNTFSKKGAVFTGWNTQPDGSGTTYLDQVEVLNLGRHGETVTLYAQWSTNDTSGAPSNGKILVQCKAGETIVIPDLPYGTKYTIKEVNLPKGWSFDSSTGEIGSVGANTVSSSQFNNKYSAEGLAFITAHKTIIGDTPQEGQFTFELYQGNTLLQSKTNGTVDTNEEILGNNDENIPNPWINTSPVEFDALQFTQEDIGKTFTYTVKEVNSGDNRINYDTHTEIVRITISDAGNGNLDCNVVYDSDDALFTNSLKSSSLQLKKNIVNSTQASEETEFNFTINLKDSVGNPISGEYPVKIKQKNYGFYDYEIPAIEYSHTNNIDDEGNRSGGFGTSQRLKDIVKIPGATTLHVEIQYGTYSSSTSYGRLYVVPGEYTGTISTSPPSGYVGYLYGYTTPYKTVNYNIEGDAVTFGFYSGTSSYNNNATQAYTYGYYAVITPYDEDGNILTKVEPREENFIETTISDGDTLTLKGGEELEITGLPDGATYEIVEQDSPGWEITNKAGETGQIVAGETAFAEFENTYSTSGKVILSGNKILYGSNLENESFEFELKDENDNVLQTAASDPQGNFSFEIDYSQEDDGNTFYYHITEKIDEERENIKWDEHIAEVSVKIEDNGQGELIPTVTLNEEDMTFTNVFYNSIEVSKLVTGEFGDKSKEFNFTLKLSENWDKNEITWTKGEETGIVDSNNFTFTLSHDDSITFEGITSNIEYEVVENDSFKNGYSSKVEGDMESSSVNPLNMELSAKGNLDSDKSVTFTNDARGVIPTEIRLRDGIFALSAIFVAAIFFVARRRKKYAS